MSHEFDIETLTRPDGIVPVDVETTAGLVREILRLREQNDRYRRALEIINGSADWLVARQAANALENIGPKVPHEN